MASEKGATISKPQPRSWSWRRKCVARSCRDNHTVYHAEVNSTQSKAIYTMSRSSPAVRQSYMCLPVLLILLSSQPGKVYPALSEVSITLLFHCTSSISKCYCERWCLRQLDTLSKTRFYAGSRTATGHARPHNCGAAHSKHMHRTC